MEIGVLVNEKFHENKFNKILIKINYVWEWETNKDSQLVNSENWFKICLHSYKNTFNFSK